MVKNIYKLIVFAIFFIQFICCSDSNRYFVNDMVDVNSVYRNNKDSQLNVLNKLFDYDTINFDNGDWAVSRLNFLGRNNGEYFVYSSSNELKTKGFFLNGNQFGDWFFYNTNKLFAYQLYDSLGNIIYNCEFNHGKISRECGRRISVSAFQFDTIVDFVFLNTSSSIFNNKIILLNDFIVNFNKFHYEKDVKMNGFNYFTLRVKFFKNSTNSVKLIFRSKDSSSKEICDTIDYNYKFR